jgi:lysozyme
MTSIELIKRFEGYAKKLSSGDCTTYLCSAGVLTIGYGSTGKGVYAGVVWTKDYALARMTDHVREFALAVLKLSPVLAADENSNRLIAITSFAYNLGTSAYQNSTLRRAVDRQDWERAKREIKRWNRAGGRVVAGLVVRREIEASML